MSLTGDLSKLKMGDLFQTLEGSRQTGVLKVWKGSELRELFFSGQGVRLLNLAELCASHVERRLLNRGQVSEEELESAKRHAAERGVRLEDVLVQRNHAHAAELEDAVRDQAEELLYDMFAWEEGNFEFLDNKAPEPGAMGDARTRALPIGPVLLESARRLDEWAEIERFIPDPSEVFAANAVSPEEREALDEEVSNVLFEVDGRSNVRAIADRTLGLLFPTAKILAELVEMGLIRLVEQEELIEAAQQEFAQKRRARAVELLDLVCERRQPRLRRNLERIADLYASLGQPERAAELHSQVASQLAASESYPEAEELLRSILASQPGHLRSQELLVKVLEETHPDSEQLFAERVHFIEKLAEQREDEVAKFWAEKLLEAPPRNGDLVRRGARAALRTGKREVALSLLVHAGEVERALGHSDALVDIYREILKLDRGNRATAVALRELLTSEKVRRRRRWILAGSVTVVVGISLWWYQGHSNATAAGALYDRAEQAGAQDPSAGLRFLGELQENYTGSRGAEEILEAADALKATLLRRVEQDREKVESQLQREVEAEVARAGAAIDANSLEEAFPIYVALLGNPRAKAQRDNIRYRVQNVLQGIDTWRAKANLLLENSAPEKLAHLDAEGIRKHLANVGSTSVELGESGLAALRDFLAKDEVRHLVLGKDKPFPEELFQDLGLLQVKLRLLEEELADRLAVHEKTGELESILRRASDAEREGRWVAAAEFYRVLAASGVEPTLRQHFSEEAERLQRIVSLLGRISEATLVRDFESALESYHSLLEAEPEIDLRGRVRFPFLLRSIPTGATVREGDKALGKTPLPLEYDPFRVATLIVERDGYQRAVYQLQGFERGHATLVLGSETLWSGDAGGAVEALPEVHAGRLYVGTRAGSLICFDPTRLEEAWRTKLSEEMGGLRGSPSFQGGVVRAVSWSGALYSVDPENGQSSAPSTLGSDGPMVGPVWSQDRLWHAHGDILQVHSLGKAALSSRRDLGEAIVRLHATSSGVLAALRGTRIQFHDAAHAQARWEFALPAPLMHFVSDATRGVALCGDGSVLVLQLADGQQLGRWQLGGAPEYEPLLASDALFVTHRGGIVRRELLTGAEQRKWDLEAEARPSAPLAIDAERHTLLVATTRGLEVLGLDDAQNDWRFDTPAPITLAPLQLETGFFLVLKTGQLLLAPRH